jgi:small subunit ribosomal protein S18
MKRGGGKGKGKARPKKKTFGLRRNKFCKFCVEKATMIDYKDVKTLMGFTPERAKVMPRRTSGVCAAHQRMLVEAIKRARNIALLPFTMD